MIGSARTTSSKLNFLVYPPADLEAPAGLPLIVFLHGRGERGTDVEMVKRHGPPAYLEAGNRVPAFLVAPQCPPEKHWGHMVESLDEMVDDMLAGGRISPERITLTGFSMGGFGTWYWARSRPDRFAALAPVAGSGSPRGDDRPLADPCIFRSTPIWILHGAADDIVSVAGADEAAARLRECGGDYRYSRLEGVDHMESCRRAFYDPGLYEWLLSKRRGAGSAA